MFFQKPKAVILGFAFILVFSNSVNAFELLSEGAMGSVSAVSANSAEDIISVMGSTAAGLRVDDDYDELPLQESSGEISVSEGYESEGFVSEEVNEVKSELELSLTKEVEGWVNDLSDKQGDVEVSYVDELPASTFVDNAEFIIPDIQIEVGIFDNNANEDSNTLYEVGRVDQAFTLISSGVNSIAYILERRIDRAATIDSYRLDDDTPSLGSGYITDLRSVSNISSSAEAQ